MVSRTSEICNSSKPLEVRLVKMNYKILIVDDELPNIRLLERLFKDDYSVLTASSGEEAVTLLDQHDVAVIVTDQRMPGMSGVELLKRTADRRPHMVRILLTGYTDLDALVEAVNCGLVYMYVSKPWKNDDLKLRIGRAVQHYEDNKRQHSLGAANDRLTGRLREMKLGVVRALATLLKLKNEQAYAHGSRVSKLARVLGERLRLTDEALSDLSVAGLLHEVGTIGSDDLLVTQLPDRTSQVLSCIPELREVSDVIGYYRENFDGSGSPFGLIGDQIPLAARIIRVASEYDRLRNPIHASTGKEHLAALDELKTQTKRLYDPQVVQALADLTGDQLETLQALSARTERPEPITCAIN
jgi:response regulator RpfG family c-di-GMP phosphodiesterase